MTTHTKDKLAAALRAVGLEALAVRAATGEFHDYLSPHALPAMELMQALAANGSAPAMRFRHRVAAGEFDASDEEAKEWASSPEGQETLRKFT